jgi:hypothetical protein
VLGIELKLGFDDSLGDVLKLGFNDGKVLGIMVGFGVGIGVGDIVGFGVGIGVGNLVGFGVGDLVGDDIGDNVGVDVGIFVLIQRGRSFCNERPLLPLPQLPSFQLLSMFWFWQQYVCLTLLTRSSHCRYTTTGVWDGQTPMV